MSENKNNKRILAALLTAVMLGGVLAGCAETPQGYVAAEVDPVAAIELRDEAVALAEAPAALPVHGGRVDSLRSLFRDCSRRSPELPGDTGHNFGHRIEGDTCCRQNIDSHSSRSLLTQCAFHYMPKDPKCH